MPLHNLAPAATKTATLPTGAIAETLDRRATIGTAITLTGGQMRMTAIQLDAGKTITTVTFPAASTVPAAITHLWVALYDQNLALLRQSPDETSPTWTESTSHTFTLTTPYVTTYTGLHYLGLCEVATTRNGLLGCVASAAVTGAIAPVLSGVSDSSLTATAPNPSAALSTNSTSMAYAYVS